MIWLLLGWLGQALFFLRFAVQWWASERAGESVAPPSFWWLSLGGAFGVGSYALASGEALLAAGHVAGICVYARNARMASRPCGRALSAPGLAVAAGALSGPALAVAAGALSGPALAVAAGALAALLGAATWAGAGWDFQVRSSGWLAVAVAGQLFWQARLVAQWWASERAGQAYFPRAFWWLSLAGNLLLLAYAVHLRDPLFVCAYLLGPIVQLRNLALARAGVAAAPVLAQ